MALATHTVTINPAFLQEIKDDHHELRQLMHHTSAMLNRSLVMKIEVERMVELLAKLRDQLAMHFSLEEAYGYFEDAIREAPQLNRRAEQLRAQHGELYSDLARLTDRAEEARYQHAPARVLVDLARDYADFAERFQDHESRESRLVQEALNRDLGAGD